MAENRLVRAKHYLAIAESKDSKREAYKRAAKEIVAHREITGDTWKQIADALGRAPFYVTKLRDWFDAGCKTETPWAHGGDSDHRRGSDVAATKRILREQPMEVVERVINDLPPRRQAQIAAAAHDSYFEENERSLDRQRSRTQAERDSARQAVEQATRPVRQALGQMKGNTVVDLLDEATEELQQILADEAMTPKAAREIEKALGRFQREFEFARQLAGGE